MKDSDDQMLYLVVLAGSIICAWWRCDIWSIYWFQICSNQHNIPDAPMNFFVRRAYSYAATGGKDFYNRVDLKQENIYQSD